MSQSWLDPVFWAATLATLVPFITALLVRINARQAVKATVASALAAAAAFVATWKAAVDAGAPMDVKTFLVVFAGALTWQRVIHTQVNVPYRIRERLLPARGLR